MPEHPLQAISTSRHAEAFYDRSVSLEEVAAVLGLTRSRVQQIEVKALQHFREEAIKRGVWDELRLHLPVWRRPR